MKAILCMCLIFVVSIVACKKDIKEFPGKKDPIENDNYNYLPLKNGNKWVYSQTVVNYNTKDSFTFETPAIYNEPLQRIDFYQDSQVNSYAYWYNEGDEMKCCAGITLVNYALIGCNGDSIRITNTASADIKLYQFCGDKYLSNLPNYKTIKSIRTIQTNTFSAGNKLLIERYFGYKVGLIYEKQTSIDDNGNIVKYSLLELKSHQF